MSMSTSTMNSGNSAAAPSAATFNMDGAFDITIDTEGAFIPVNPAGSVSDSSPVINGDSLAAAFAAVATDAAHKQTPEMSLGENGDLQYSGLTVEGYGPKMEKFAGDCLEMSQQSVMDQMKAAAKAKKGPGAGKKNKGQAPLPDDPTENIPMNQRSKISAQMSGLCKQISCSTNSKDRVTMIIMLAKMCFRERAVTGGKRLAQAGKGHRSLSYFMFSCFHNEFPDYARALVPLFIEYGYFGDMDALIAHFKGKDEAIVEVAIDTYVKAIDQDVRIITASDSFPNGRGLPTCSSVGEVMTHSQLLKGFTAIAAKVTSMQQKGKTQEDILKVFPNVQGLCNAAKWMKRAGKHNSSHRDRIVHAALTEGGLAAAKAHPKASAYLSITDKIFRKIITSLTGLSGVVEQMMAAGNWTWDPSKQSAGATYKYRISWANEVVGENVPYSMDDTGNRHPDDPARVAMRHKVQKAALDGALKGAALDSIKFADAIWSKVGGYSTGCISGTERTILHAQFMDLCSKFKENVLTEYAKQIEEWQSVGSPANMKPIDPLNIISTIDVSGSMGSEMPYAVINGIIGAVISNLGRWFITFDSKPKLIKLNGDNIVDWVTQVKNSPWGGSTNMDAANKLCIDVMKKVKDTIPNFDGKIIHIIHTDGQFNPNFAGFNSGTHSYSYSYSEDSIAQMWSPFVDRAKKRFKDAGFALPMTAFWNYRSTTTGFPAHGKYEGVKLVSGLSSGLMYEVLAGKITFKVDKTGAVVAEVDPIESLLSSLAHPGFDLVADTIYATAHGLFAKSDNVEACKSFWATYAPKPKAKEDSSAGGK